MRNDVECAIGFDFGPRGSITEDAFWALVAMERGHRTRWVEGYLEEQSTQSVVDFIKQRERWFRGLVAVVFDAPGGTFRDALYAGYKETRGPMPDELRPQIPYIRRLVAALRLPVIEEAGVAVSRLEPARATLEETFLNITSRLEANE